MFTGCLARYGDERTRENTKLKPFNAVNSGVVDITWFFSGRKRLNQLGLAVKYAFSYFVLSSVFPGE